MEGDIEKKLKEINVSNPAQAIKHFVKVRPVGCDNKTTVLKDL
jgi:ribosomal protein S27E